MVHYHNNVSLNFLNNYMHTQGELLYKSTCVLLYGHAPPPPGYSHSYHTLSQSVEALSDPPCFLIKASKAFSSGYFSLPIKTTGKKERQFAFSFRCQNLKPCSNQMYQRMCSTCKYLTLNDWSRGEQ